jgi:hypothetical protein
MKTAYCLGVVAALALGATGAHADVDISVAIQGEIAPGVYGRIDLNGRPPPPLVYARPVIIEQPPTHVVVAEPLYLHVPPEHARAWRLHCREYHACNRQVYFVRSQEYEPGYVRGREHERHEEHERRQEHRDERREEHRDERRDEHHEEHREHHDHEGDHDHGDHDHG